MSGFGAGLAGFSSGLNSGVDTGLKLYQLAQEDKLQKVREQGIAEAQALANKATPQVQDLGDQQNLTSNPQMSRDPNAAPEPVNTSLQQFQNNAQAAQDGGPGSSPVAAPSVQSTDDLSDKPMASAAPNAKIDDPDAPSPFANGIAAQPYKRFNVDGQGFDSKDEADAYAKSKAPKSSDFYAQTLVPKMKDALLAQGKVDEAERWEKFATDEKGRKYGETWLNAVKMAHAGDYDGAAGELMKLHPHFEDGYDLVSATPGKGPDGSSGFTMKVRDPNGNITESFQNSKTLVEMGAPQLSPIAAFQMMEKRQTAVDTMAAQEAVRARHDDRLTNRILGNTKIKEEGQNTRTDKKIEAAADNLETKIDANTERDKTRAGYKEDQIRLAAQERAKNDAARIAASGQYRKGASPEETRRMVWQNLQNTDMKFGKLSPDEQVQRVNATVDALASGGKPAAQTVQNPFQNGISPQAAPAAAAPQSTPAPAAGAVPPGKKPVFINGKITYVDR